MKQHLIKELNGKFYVSLVFFLTESGGGQTVPSKMLPAHVDDDWILLQYRRSNEQDPASMDASSYSFAHNTWKQYKSGFGSPMLSSPKSNDDAAYWLGLETMSQLTRFGEWELLVMTKVDPIPSNTKVAIDEWNWKIWRDFKVGSESALFRLSIGEKSNSSESGGDDRLQWEQIRDQPFVTYDRWSPVEQDDAGNESCAHESIGGWWRDPTSDICLTTCFNCVERNAQGLVSKSSPTESLMAMRRIPRGATVQEIKRIQNPRSSSPPQRFGSSQIAVDEVSRKLDNFADQVSTWINKRKRVKEQEVGEVDVEAQGKETSVDDLESTKVINETDETAFSHTPFLATTATPTADGSTPTPITFEDVNFDSFDDEDYTSLEESGSGSSSSENTETPFNAKNFWDWG